MKRLQVKVWPDVVGYIPCLIPFPAIENKKNDVFLDLSNCSNVNSTGLAILLMKILKLLNRGSGNRSWDSDFDLETEAIENIKNLNFFNILDKYRSQRDLFFKIDQNCLNNEPITNFTSENSNTTSYPIYVLNFNENTQNRRNSTLAFRAWLYNILEPYGLNFNLHFTQLIAILTEMAKNSADHTNENAYFGLDITKSGNEENIPLCFSFCDLGIGIKRTIQEHLQGTKSISREKHWSLSESYHFALKPGGTTKPASGDNKGIGMSLILDGSKGIGLHLSVFDAHSRGILSNIMKISHSEIRRNFLAVGKDVGFCYFGKISLNRINK